MYTEAPRMQNPGDLRIPDGVNPNTILVDGKNQPVINVLNMGDKAQLVNPSSFDVIVQLPESNAADEEAVLLETTFWSPS